MELPIEKVSTLVKRHPEYEAPGHPCGRLIGHSWGGWLLGPNPFGVPRRRIDRAFLGRLAFEPNPFGALELSRLARETELGPMVPTLGSLIKILKFSYKKKRSRSPLEKFKRIKENK